MIEQKQKKTNIFRTKQRSTPNLKRRLFQIGSASMSQSNLKNPTNLKQISNPLMKLNSSFNKNQNSPRILKVNLSQNRVIKTNSKEFSIRKKVKKNVGHHFSNDISNCIDLSPKNVHQTTENFYQNKGESKLEKIGHKSTEDFFRNDSFYKQKENVMAKNLIEKMSGKITPENSSRSMQQQNEIQIKDEILEDQHSILDTSSKSGLDEYVRLVINNVNNIDEFLYLVKKSVLKKEGEEYIDQEDNIYQLTIVSFQQIKERDRNPNFQYYTVSKKGFCQYINGKPHSFIEIEDWLQQKNIYENIKKLSFFNRFRRWKTLKMWKKTVVKQRIETCSENLEEKLFFMNKIMRNCLFEVREIGLEMEKSIMIISKNEGNYTLQNFKHCQEKTRRETSIVVEEFSRKSRTQIKKCFESKLNELRDSIKKVGNDEKANTNTVSLNLKQTDFQNLGFPAKMSYEHRSKLRKEVGKFVRFSYLADNMYLSCLSGIFNNQISEFISKLNQIHIQEPVRLKNTLEDGKNIDDIEREKMFNIYIMSDFENIPQSNLTEIPLQSIEGEIPEIKAQRFRPLYHIVKDTEITPTLRKYCPKICEYWIKMKPSLDDIYDEFNFVIRESLNSLKYFERWSKHRDMQKYINVLEEWDDIVCGNWEISENDNLDPMSIIDNYDSSLNKIKVLFKVSEDKMGEKIRQKMTDFLNMYRQIQQVSFDKIQSENLVNPSQTIQLFLNNISKTMEKLNTDIPQRVELGLFSIHLTKIKNYLIQSYSKILQQIKGRLPSLIEDRTCQLNDWLILYGTKIKEQIKNIDDFVKITKIVEEIELNFEEKKDLCSQLGLLYQTMQFNKINSKKRKQFQTQTLKLKDHLEQSLLNVGQTIERKSDFYIRQVMKYHLPQLFKKVAKERQTLTEVKFVQLNSNRAEILKELQKMKDVCDQLKKKASKCAEYIKVLKLNQNDFEQLNKLDEDINMRLELWENLEKWQQFSKNLSKQVVKDISNPYSYILGKFKATTQKLSQKLPQNQVLSYLSKYVDEYFHNLPLLEGFDEELGESHWEQIYGIFKDRKFDLKKKQFTIEQFLKSDIKNHTKEINQIFEKCRIENILQKKYCDVEEKWNSLIVKCTNEHKYFKISNEEQIRQTFDELIISLSSILSNPFAETLKQYSISYNSLIQSHHQFERWIKVQNRFIEFEQNTKIIDIKKLSDYNSFENAEKIYKIITKQFNNKTSENGVKIAKLLFTGVEEKLIEIEDSLVKIEDNIWNIIHQHRKLFPSFFMFSSEELLKIITDPCFEHIEWAAKKMLPGLKKIQLQGQRITGFVNIDDQKITRSPITLSMNSETQQVLYQIIESFGDWNRKSMRSCRYKTIETNLSELIDAYNLQYLLAISKVDFSNYTEISIENQQQTPEALREFYKVMKKDTSDQIKLKDNLKSQTSLLKYERLILQSIIHQEILQNLIKNNAVSINDYNWLKEIRFGWQENANTEEMNIMVKMLHVNLKYGEQFIGTQAKIIINSDVNLLTALKYGSFSIYKGNSFALERFLNSIGHKMIEHSCCEISKVEELKKFLVGAYYCNYVPFLKNIDLLNQEEISEIVFQNWLPSFKEQNIKKTSSYLKDCEPKPLPILMSIQNYADKSENFRGKMRIIEYTKPNSAIINCCLSSLATKPFKISNIVNRLFEIIDFLEESSFEKRINLEQFIDLCLGEHSLDSEIAVVEKFMSYIENNASQSMVTSMWEHISQVFPSLCKNDHKKAENLKQKSQKLKLLEETLLSRKVLILSGKGISKKHAVNSLFKENYKIVPIFYHSIKTEELYPKGNVEFSWIHNNCKKNEKQILYIQNPQEDIMLYFEQLISSKDEIFYGSETYIVVQCQSLERLMDPRLMASFSIVHYEFLKEYINEYGQEWAQKLDSNKQKTFMKLYTQVVVPTFDNWEVKNPASITKSITTFFSFLNSLQPFNNITEAVIYSLIWMHQDLKEDYVKLEYLVKKYIGEDRIPQNSKVYSLIYDKKKNGIEKLIDEKEYLQNYVGSCDLSREFVLTSEGLHYSTIMKRILTNTNQGIYLSGCTSSGKTTLLKLFKELNFQNTYHLYVTLHQKSNLNKFTTKIQSVIQQHSLKEMGAKINYQNALIMVDDVNMDEDQEDKINLIKQMLKYKIYCKKNKMYSLKDVLFICAGNQSCEGLQDCAVELKLRYNENAIKGIFMTILKECFQPQVQIKDMYLQRSISSAFDTFKKYSFINKQLTPLAVQIQKRIYLSFKTLKIKDYSNPIKQIQRFWDYSMKENLEYFIGIVNEPLFKSSTNQPHNISTMYSYLYSRTSEDTGVKKIEYVRDIKKLYNIINQKIQKYNESDNKNYGDSLQFINFDETLKRIIKMSNNLHSNQDYMLFGRGGIGKNSITKLVAFLHGITFKMVKGDLTKIVLGLVQDATKLSSYLICYNVESNEDVESIAEFYYRDFGAQIIGNKELDKGLRIANPKATKTPNPNANFFAQALRTTISKTNLLTGYTDSYIPVKAKPSIIEQQRIRNTFRIVLNLKQKDLLLDLPIQTRKNLFIDIVHEIPTQSVIEYNQKLLAVDGIQYEMESCDILTQIYGLERQELKLSIKDSDNCIRLFSSFKANLVEQMQAQALKYKNVVEFGDQFKKIFDIVSTEISELHKQLKQISKKISQGDQSLKQQKYETQSTLREKSTLLSTTQRLLDFINCLLPIYKPKHQFYEKFLTDRKYLDECFAVAASYFSYSSKMPYLKRKQMLRKWYEKVELLKGKAVMEDMLGLFLLTQQEFNSEPVDDLKEFYENMAMVFHSVKPVIIRDSTMRAKKWLEMNCSFVIIPQNCKNFLDQISENISKPSNILIQIQKQETMDNLSNSIINNLLYITDTTTSINLKGEQIEINKQAKVYLILKDHIKLSKEMDSDFATICFHQSQEMNWNIIQKQYFQVVETQNFMNQLEWKRKVRNLNLDCENLMSLISQCIIQHMIGEDQDEKSKQIESIIEKVATISDKTMTKAQNFYSKIKQKEELVRDFNQKVIKCQQKLSKTELKQFYQTIKQTRVLLDKMQNLNKKYYNPCYNEFMRTITMYIHKFADGSNSFVLFSLKHWGQMYNYQDFLIFAFGLLMMVKGVDEKVVSFMIGEDMVKNGRMKQHFGMDEISINGVEKYLENEYSQLLKSNQFNRIENFLKYKEEQPLIQILNLDHDPKRQKLNILTTQKPKDQLKKQFQQSKMIVVGIDDNIQLIVKKFNTEDLIEMVVFEDLSVLENLMKVVKFVNGFERVAIYFCCQKNVEVQLLGQQTQLYCVNLDHDCKIFKNVIGNLEIQSNQEKSSEKQIQNNQQIEQELVTKMLELLIKKITKFYKEIAMEPPYISKEEVLNNKLTSTTSQFAFTDIQKAGNLIKWFEEMFSNKFVIFDFKKLNLKMNEVLQNNSQNVLKDLIALLQDNLDQKRVSFSIQNLEQEKKIMGLNLGWFNELRKLYEVEDDHSLVEKCLVDVDNLITLSQEYTHTPKVQRSSRSSRKQLVQKGRKQSLNKSKNPSLKSIDSKKLITNKSSIEQTVMDFGNGQSSLVQKYLKRQIQNLDTILKKMNLDLQKIKKQLEDYKKGVPITENTIKKLLMLDKNQVPSEWKWLLKNYLPWCMSLSITIKNLLSFRNEIYTYLSKLTLSTSIQIDFKHILNPVELLKAYFNTQFLSSQNHYYFITNSLTQQEIDDSEYLKLTLIYSNGWKLSGDGYFEFNGETKEQFLGHYYVVKKNFMPSHAVNVVEMHLNPDQEEKVIKLHVLAKKNNCQGIVPKLYLKTG